MTSKTIYNRETLTEFTTVAGNISDCQQGYKIHYYPKSLDLPNKIALFTFLVSPELLKQQKLPTPQSLYFSSLEQLKTLIFDLTNSYFYFKEKKTSPVISIAEFRKIMLSDFIIDLSKTQLKTWSEK